jgi:hypothetical protein
MALILLGRLDKKLLIIIVIDIVHLINLIVLNEVSEKFFNNTLINLEEGIGIIIIGLFMFCKYKEKQNKTYKNKKSFKYILFLFLFRLIKSSYEIFCINIFDKKYRFTKVLNTTNGFILLLMSLVTYILLKYKYYIHHIISMFLYLAIGISIDLILHSYQEIKYDYIYFYIIYVVNEVLIFCYIKYLMDKLYYNYKEVVIYWGIAGLIAIILTYVALYIYQYKLNINNNIINELREYFDFDKLKIVNFIFLQLLYVLLNGGIFYFLTILMIDYFKPNYTVITDQIYVFVRCIAYEDRKNKYYTFIPFVFQILALLIYFEIIELNFFKLNENTTKNILEREEIEKEEQNEDEQIKEEIQEIEINGEYILWDTITNLDEEN